MLFSKRNLSNRIRSMGPCVTDDAFSGIADDWTNLLAIWSLRVMRTDMVGEPIVRLREDNGDTEADFSIASADLNADGTGTLKNSSSQTVAAWLTANSASNPYIADWYDQFGSLDASQNTTGDQPLYNASAINSLPAANPLSDDDLSFSSTDVVTAYMVAEGTGTDTERVWLGRNDNSQNYLYAPNQSGNIRVNANALGSNAVYDSSVSNPGPAIIHGLNDFSGGDLNAGVNGTWGTAVAARATMNLLSLFNYSAGAFSAVGYCPEVVLFSANKEGHADETALIADMKTVYGIA